MINLDCSTHAVLSVKAYGHGLYEVALERNGLAFTPGDCVALYNGGGQSRPYSIASGSRDADLRFLIREMDGGEVSPWLAGRTSGDTVRISPPFGWFRPGQEIGDAPFAFMATGTGIAPFLSYVATFDRPPSCCLYGVRHESDAAGFDTLDKRCPTHLAVSREATRHRHGRITGLFSALPLDDRHHYYACGRESMVGEATAWLRAQGIPLERIHREVFFHG